MLKIHNLNTLALKTIDFCKPEKNKEMKCYLSKVNGDEILFKIDDLEMSDDVLIEKDTLVLKLKTNSFSSSIKLKDIENYCSNYTLTNFKKWFGEECNTKELFDNFKTILTFDDKSANFTMKFLVNKERKKIMTKIYNDSKKPISYKNLNKGDKLSLILKLNGIRFGPNSSCVSLSMKQVKKYTKVEKVTNDSSIQTEKTIRELEFEYNITSHEVIPVITNYEEKGTNTDFEDTEIKEEFDDDEESVAVEEDSEEDYNEVPEEDDSDYEETYDEDGYMTVMGVM